MVSGLFEPIGHKKWPLKFHFHDFQEFVLGDDGRAYQNELRVRFASHTPHICLFCDHNNVYHYNFLCCWIIMTGKWRGIVAQPCQRVDLRATVVVVVVVVVVNELL